MNMLLSDVHQLPKGTYYITLNGKIVDDYDLLHDSLNFKVIPRVLGGKGGFGSLLRSFRIFRSTNQGMCRDLSGRRLKDVKEEERLKKWILKKKEREEEKEKKEQSKYEKLKSGPPKHDFQDTEFNNARDEILEKNEDAFEQGLKMLKDGEGPSTSGTVLNKNKKRPRIKDNEDKKSGKKIKGDWGYGMGIEVDSSDEEEKATEPESNISSAIKLMKQKQKEKLASVMKKEVKPKKIIPPKPSKILEKKEEIIQKASTVVPVVTEVPVVTVPVVTEEPVVTEVPVVIKPSEPVPKPILDVDINLEDFSCEQDLVELGLDVLKGALHKRGLKMGGSVEERAARLFQVKGIEPEQYPKNIKAPKKKS